MLEKFNQQNFKELQLKTSNLQLSDEYAMILVVDLQQITQALSYMQTFNENMPRLTELQNHKFNTFVITKDNFDIFYRTKGLDEYLKFFKKTILQKFNSVLLLQTPWFRRVVKAIWILFLCLVIGFPLYILSVRYNLFGLYGGMPSLKGD